MNYYTYVNSTGRPGEIEPPLRRIWAFEIPQKALQCDYLLCAVLSYAAMHIHIHNPDDLPMGDLAHRYFGDALRSLGSKVACVNDTNADFVFPASLLIALQSSLSWLDPCCKHDSYQLPLQWLTMGKGVASVLRVSAPAIRSTSLNVMTTSFLPPRPQREEEEHSPKFPFTKPVCEAFESPDVQALRKALKYLEYLFWNMHRDDAVTYNRRRLFLFPLVMEREYVELLRSHDPRALCVLAYYFGAMRCCEGFWWYDGRAKHEITGISGLLPRSWKKQIAWPLAVIERAETPMPKWTELAELIPLTPW